MLKYPLDKEISLSKKLERMGKVTLKDIAGKSGVSVSTVSRILSGDMSRRPSEETRGRVLAVAHELGFIESRTKSIRKARAPITLSSVFLSDHESLSSEFFQKILSGIDKEIGRLGEEYNIRYSVKSSLDSSFLSELEGSDAAIILGRGSDETIAAIRKRIPVLVYAGLNSIGGMDEVVSDAEEGMADAVRYLYGKGCRAIAYVGPADTSEVLNEHRFRGYLEGLDSIGISRGNAIFESVHLSPQEGYEGTVRLLERTIPDAIVAANDNTAIGVLKALTENGLKVPDDVMLTGFDNSESSAFLEPSLTTFAVFAEELGRFAAKIIVDRCLNERSYPIRISIPYRLIERKSTEVRS